MNDKAVIVTSFTGGTKSEQKKLMTKTLVKSLHKQGLFVCLASHSMHDEETQSYCDLFVYDKDNSFHMNGHPQRTDNHGVAELRSMYNAASLLLMKGFTNFFKVSFDTDPTIQLSTLINECRATNKRAVTSHWGNPGNLDYGTLTTLAFYSDIDFFFETLSPDEAWRMSDLLEVAWFKSVQDKNLLSDIHIVDSNLEFFGRCFENYSECGGTHVEKEYSF